MCKDLVTFSTLTREGEAVQIVRLGLGNGILYELLRLILTGRGMIAEALQRHLLLGHQLAGVLVHLCIVYAQSAEYGKRLKYGGIRFGEGQTARLHRNNSPSAGTVQKFRHEGLATHLVYQLCHAYDRLLGIHNGHTEYGMCAIDLSLGAYLIVLPDPIVNIANVHRLSGGGHKLCDLRQRRVAQIIDGGPGYVCRLRFAT